LRLRPKVTNTLLEPFQLIFSMFIITFVIISFSSGMDSAIRRVSEANVPLFIVLLPSALLRIPFFCKNVRNSVAAILLQPSLKG